MSPSHRETPGLIDAFYESDEKFKELYEKYERSTKVNKDRVKASEFFNLLLQERKDTGRIYIMNVDNANNQSMYVSERAPVRMTNLCLVGDTILQIRYREELLDMSLEDVVTLIQAGNSVEVLSYNIKEQGSEYKSILAASLTDPEAELFEIEDEETGKKIYCTPEHKIFTKNRGYVEAQYLDTQDQLVIT